MDKQKTNGSDSLIYYRLIALWVLTEAMLGGIIHGFRIPVSGLIVGSCAVICICLIAWYVPKKGAILKATIVVAIFKMMLSPQAPPPAYVAVFFQGLMGEALFWNRRFYKLSCLLLAVLSLLESGFQRILMLTIIYGDDMWTVINEFFNRLTKQKLNANYSLLIGGAYVFVHLVVGIIVGWFAGVLPTRVERWTSEQGNHLFINAESVTSYQVRSRRKKNLKKGLFLVWLVLVFLYVQSEFKIGGSPILSPHLSLRILIRSAIIVLTWYFIVSPLLMRLLHYWLQKRKVRSQADVQRVLQLLPSTMQLVAQSWKASDLDGETGWRRFKDTIRKILVNALQSTNEKPVWILTGMLNSGKTTSLKDWSESRDDVAGILTPVIQGKRMFMNAKTREQFPMEAQNGEGEVLHVGRFTFSKKSFDSAVSMIRQELNSRGWLLIDEVGPMELRGEGFCDVVKEALKSQHNNQTIVLVVREGLVEKVKQYFGLEDATVIKKGSFKEGW
jgi:nucleoside-triphosphatase THEP1